MKSHFLQFIFAVLIMTCAMPAQSAIYGVCCPICVSPYERKIDKDTNNCYCTCSNDYDEISDSEGNIICCDGANDVSTGEINALCCENAGGKYSTLGGQGLRAACCIENSSRDINGNLEEVCCNIAGGAIRGTGANKKCCRQSPQGS